MGNNICLCGIKIGNKRYDLNGLLLSLCRAILSMVVVIARSLASSSDS